MFSNIVISALALATPSLAVCHYWDCPARSLEGTLGRSLDGSFEQSLEGSLTEDLTEAANLGRPREWANPGFKRFPTCDHAGPTEHTMAQMTINFRNPCEEVVAEISARAGATANGEAWVDPHNRGHYAVVATESNLLTVQRWTATYKYRDVQTFSMTASGSGCKVNACSVSQGNSNNDQGTNYCNMGNLFCTSATASPSTGVKC